MKSVGSSDRAAFTLIELLMVVALVAGLAAFLLGSLSGGRRAQSLQSGQALVANLIAAARTQALTRGTSVRLLVNNHSSGEATRARYLRHLALQIFTEGRWQLVSETVLPEHVYVVPGNAAAFPAGLFDSTADAWTRADGAPLRSTVFVAINNVTETIGAGTAEEWMTLSIAAAGTTAQSGNIVLAVGERRAPSLDKPGDSPIQLLQPELVRGLKLSQYGVTTLVSDRLSF